MAEEPPAAKKAKTSEFNCVDGCVSSPKKIAFITGITGQVPPLIRYSWYTLLGGGWVCKLAN